MPLFAGGCPAVGIAAVRPPVQLLQTYYIVITRQSARSEHGAASVLYRK